MIEILPVVHYGPKFPEESLFCNKLIKFADCIYLCKLNGRYPLDVLPEVELPKDIVISQNEFPPHYYSVVPLENQIQNMAYYLWENNGWNHVDCWLTAEKYLLDYELELNKF